MTIIYLFHIFIQGHIISQAKRGCEWKSLRRAAYGIWARKSLCLLSTRAKFIQIFSVLVDYTDVELLEAEGWLYIIVTPCKDDNRSPQQYSDPSLQGCAKSVVSFPSVVLLFPSKISEECFGQVPAASCQSCRTVLGCLVFLKLSAPAAHLDLLPTPESVRLCILGTARAAELWTTLRVARGILGTECESSFEDRAGEQFEKPGCKQVPQEVSTTSGEPLFYCLWQD